jgi:hypothetical protein
MDTRTDNTIIPPKMPIKELLSLRPVPISRKRLIQRYIIAVMAKGTIRESNLRARNISLASKNMKA